MAGWTLLEVTRPTQGRTFHRPLDSSESIFFWSSFRNGASDALLRLNLHLLNDAKDAQHFSDADIMKAWLSTKRRYPLSGATVQLGDPGGAPLCGTAPNACTPPVASDPHFVVRERDLAILSPREIVFGKVASAEKVDQRVTEIFDGPRPLSNELLMQLYVLRETGRNDVLHLMILVAHCIMDVAAAHAFARCFLDTLTRDGGYELPQMTLEERLAMAVPQEEREPVQLRLFSTARRRWRKAVGALICLARTARLKGGHTLPCQPTRRPSTPYVASRAREIGLSFTCAETAAVLTNCRLHNVTFGTAYLVLAQAAMTRVLYRRYLRGDISEEEWAYRKRQPHSIRGSFNLRPHLDRAWFEGGGGGEFLLSVGMHYLELPFMTLGETARKYQPRGKDSVVGLAGDSPPFPELLAFDRFLHRAGLARKKMTEFFRHPLCFEIMRATDQLRANTLQLETLRRMEEAATADAYGTHSKSNEKVRGSAMVWAHGGSSFGDLDSMLPRKYPLVSTHPLSLISHVPHPFKAGYPPPSPFSVPSTWTPSEVNPSPKIVLKTSNISLHVRQGQLYVGASTSGGQLRVFVYYDSNVFEEEVVKEWLDELKGAVSWYLLRTHEPRRARESHRGRHRQLAFSERVQANL